MQEPRNWDRTTGVLLFAFVAVQLFYLFIDIVVLSPPAPYAPISTLRAMVVEHAATIRWLALVPLFTFFGLLMPASVGLRRRLERLAPNNPWPDLTLVGALLMTVTVVITLLALAVFGLVPSAELSDSMLRAMMMVDMYGVWVAGNFALALFVGAASIAMLQLRQPARWLARLGLVTSAFSAVGALWVVSADVEGPLFGLCVLSRGLAFVWLFASGVWMFRSTPAIPAATAHVASPAT